MLPTCSVFAHAIFIMFLASCIIHVCSFFLCLLQIQHNTTTDTHSLPLPSSAAFLTLHDKLLIAQDFDACLVSILAAMASLSDQAIVVGGLAGMSAANTVLENGGGVFLLDKVTSDTLKGGAKKPELASVLCENSGADVEWLLGKFSLNLSLVARLGGHSAPRTHRGKERFPGMTPTHALVQMVEEIAEKTDKAKMVTKARQVKAPD